MTDMYVFYTLNLHLDRLVGGTPKHPEIVRRWQEARSDALAKSQPGEPQTVEAATEATIAALGDQALDESEAVQGIWTGFITDQDGNLAWEARNIKAMLKESANIVRVLPDAKINGKVIPLKARVAERVFPEPKIITLTKDDKPVAEAESSERAIHVMTQMGPRTALKRTDHLTDVDLSCTLRVLNDKLISEKILRLILNHARYNGLGTDRSTGAGTFEYELKKLEE
jgi:hypothetical protein